jgi:phospholipid transport system substrate-binding protein
MSACLLLLCCASGQATEPEQPSLQAQAQTKVESFHTTLLEVLRLPQQNAREALLQPQIEALFDIRSIARISLGRTWRTLDAAQQQAFEGLLAELIVATYASRFDGFNNQRFVTNGVEGVKSGFVVRTHLLRNNGDSVSLDYFLRDGKVFNVVADGVSDLSLRRADYNSIIKNEGYARLITHIKTKIAEARTTV